jgi:nucleoside-diphosphate-sugar epimerase
MEPPANEYGCNKFYCEQLGIYLQQILPVVSRRPTGDVGFPGMLSGLIAFWCQSGTSDYGGDGACCRRMFPTPACVGRCTHPHGYVTPSSCAATQALREALAHQVFNVTSFSLSAEEFRLKVLKHFPEAQITYQPDLKRQGIVDSWPADLDDSAACREWGWQPKYDVDRSFDEYLVPNIRQRYQG